VSRVVYIACRICGARYQPGAEWCSPCRAALDNPVVVRHHSDAWAVWLLFCLSPAVVGIAAAARASTFALELTALSVMWAIGFVPVAIAYHKNHSNKGAIFLLALFVGWTVIGWVVAFVWACSSNPNTRNPMSVRSSAGHLRACPFCAEPIHVAARLCKHCRSAVVPHVTTPSELTKGHEAQVAELVVGGTTTWHDPRVARRQR
jgi:hypothetical protein